MEAESVSLRVRIRTTLFTQIWYQNQYASLLNRFTAEEKGGPNRYSVTFTCAASSGAVIWPAFL
jgi:hypothetical protein